jgi:hypothetical protein
VWGVGGGGGLCELLWREFDSEAGFLCGTDFVWFTVLR